MNSFVSGFRHGFGDAYEKMQRPGLVTVVLVWTAIAVLFYTGHWIIATAWIVLGAVANIWAHVRLRRARDKADAQSIFELMVEPCAVCGTRERKEWCCCPIDAIQGLGQEHLCAGAFGDDDPGFEEMDRLMREDLGYGYLSDCYPNPNDINEFFDDEEIAEIKANNARLEKERQMDIDHGLWKAREGS